MRNIFNVISAYKQSPIFNCAARCAGGAAVAVGAFFLVPYMPVAATLLGIGSFLIWSESLETLLKTQYPHTLPPDERVPHNRGQVYKP